MTDRRGQTDGQNYDSQDRASIAASRGKNETDSLPGGIVTGIVRRASTVVLRADVVSSWT